MKDRKNRKRNIEKKKEKIKQQRMRERKNKIES